MTRPIATTREPDPFRRTRWSPVVRWRLAPWWLRVTLVYAVARVITTIFVLALASVQQENPWTGAHPDYFEFANIWDARWYGFIAAYGYPDELPRTDEGYVAENAWAFLPLYPGVVRLVMLTGMGWNGASVVVSVLAGLATALVLHRLMSRFLEPDRAMFAVVLFCVAPVAPIMQFGYAESLGFLWIAVALLLLVDRRYGWLLPVIAVWAFTRPGTLAFALTLGLHWIVRWFTRERDPFPMRERWIVAGVTVFAGAVGFAWPLIVWAVTGEPSGYIETELAWRSAYIGYQELVPFTAWFLAGQWWLSQPLGTIAVVALIVGFALALFAPAVRRLGIDIRLWLASYGLYLLAVFFPQSSTFRLLAPMFPLAGALAVPRALWYRCTIVVVFLLLQVGWLLIGWGIDGRDWTPP